MNWKSISEKPQTTEPVTALIAARYAVPDSDEPYLLGIYCWNGERWVDEESGHRLPPGEYFYLLEDELIEDLKKVAA